MHDHPDELPDPCPECGGFVDDGTTAVTLDAPWGVVVVRGVPAWVCRHCGEAWISDAVSAVVEAQAQRGADRNALLSIFEFGDPSD